MPLADTPLQRLKDAFFGTSTTDATANPALRTSNVSTSGVGQTYGPDNADNEAVVTTDAEQVVKARLYGFDGTAWDRVRSVGAGILSVAISDTTGSGVARVVPTTDAAALGSNGGLEVISALHGLINGGTTWSRIRVAASAMGLLIENGPYSVTRVVADVQVKATAGFVHLVSITSIVAIPTAGLLTIYDSAAESGTIIYSEWITTGIQGHTIMLDAPCGTGIYVGFDASLANVQATVVWR